MFNQLAADFKAFNKIHNLVLFLVKSSQDILDQIPESFGGLEPVTEPNSLNFLESLLYTNRALQKFD